MPSLLIFFIRRFTGIGLTLLVVTVLLYGVAMTFSPEDRAQLYFPQNTKRDISETAINNIRKNIIARYGLDAPFPVQYGLWIAAMARGDWGWSVTANDFVLPALLRLTPATAELSFFSVVIFIPLGLLAGGYAGAHSGRKEDHTFRLAAFTAASLPPFILAILLMAVFYVGLHWFPPGRISDGTRMMINEGGMRTMTGMLTIDALLNGRSDIFLEALRHLVLPVITLSLYHWATLGRISRAAMIEELGKDYVVAARARGLKERRVIWRHALRNTLIPALTSSALSAATLVTGVFVVEAIFNIKGVSYFLRNALITATPDLPAALGFTIYSVLMVLGFMLFLDLLQAALDPRFRAGMEAR